MVIPSLPHAIRAAIRDLGSASGRASQGLFVAEGVRCCEDIAEAGVDVVTVVLTHEASERAVTVAERLYANGATVYRCRQREMVLMADAATPQDVLAVVATLPERPLGPRVLVLDGIADPGNAGTMMRTAAWFGATDVVTGPGTVDLYHPKVVRASVGAMVRLGIRQGVDLPAFLAGLDHTVVAAVARDGVTPSALAQAGTVAICIGSEAHGLQPAVLEQARVRVTIPGAGTTESLNAAVAAGILWYELFRSA